MNTPHRFEPVAPLFLAEGVVVHSSTRTSVSTNLSDEAQRAAVVTVGSARLDMRVGTAGELEVRYTAQPVVRMAERMHEGRTFSPRR